MMQRMLAALLAASLGVAGVKAQDLIEAEVVLTETVFTQRLEAGAFSVDLEQLFRTAVFPIVADADTGTGGVQCPAGMVEFTGLRGRFPIGLTPNGTLGGALGAAYADSDGPVRRGGTAQTLTASFSGSDIVIAAHQHGFTGTRATISAHQHGFSDSATITAHNHGFSDSATITAHNHSFSGSIGSHTHFVSVGGGNHNHSFSDSHTHTVSLDPDGSHRHEYGDRPGGTGSFVQSGSGVGGGLTDRNTGTAGSHDHSGATGSTTVSGNTGSSTVNISGNTTSGGGGTLSGNTGNAGGGTVSISGNTGNAGGGTVNIQGNTASGGAGTLTPAGTIGSAGGGRLTPAGSVAVTNVTNQAEPAPARQVMWCRLQAA